MQWRIQVTGPPLFLDQTEARRAEKFFFGDRPPLPPYVSVWMTVPPLSQGMDPALVCHVIIPQRTVSFKF